MKERLNNIEKLFAIYSENDADIAQKQRSFEKLMDTSRSLDDAVLTLQRGQKNLHEMLKKMVEKLEADERFISGISAPAKDLVDRILNLAAKIATTQEAQQ